MGKEKDYGGWKRVNSIGGGGQAQAYLVENAEGQNGVLKEFTNKTRLRGAKQEIAALRRVNSSKIPKVLDSGGHWIVTEYCGRRNLEKKIKDDGWEVFSVVKKLKWFCDVAEAVRDAHSVGVMHRDIKPNNIVISNDNQVAFVIDFGLTRIEDEESSLTSEGELLGTAAFAAPECFPGRDEQTSCSSASDVYSLGKLLFWMISNGKHIVREDLGRAASQLQHLDRNVVARLMYLFTNAVVLEASRRLSAEELLKVAVDILRYYESIENERRQDIVRIIDAIGLDGTYNKTSSFSVELGPILQSDISAKLPIFRFGTQQNIVFAQRIENPFDRKIGLLEVVIGGRAITFNRQLEVAIVQDENGFPGEKIIGKAVYMGGDENGGLLRFTIDGTLPNGVAWLTIRPITEKTSFQIFSSSKEVIWGAVEIAEKFSDQAAWAVKNSTSLALQIKGKLV